MSAHSNARTVGGRVVTGVIAACVGALVGLVINAAWGSFKNEMGTPYAGVSSAAGAALGLLIGVSAGNLNLEGRSARLITGIVVGLLFGFLGGAFWAQVEHSADRSRLSGSGIPWSYLDDGKHGLSPRDYQLIGLRNGLILGPVAGGLVACIWNLNSKWKRLFAVIGIVSLSLLVLGIFKTGTEFRALSVKNLNDKQDAWEYEHERWQRIRRH